MSVKERQTELRGGAGRQHIDSSLTPTPSVLRWESNLISSDRDCRANTEKLRGELHCFGKRLF